VSYVVTHNSEKRCAIIDPVWHFDPASGHTSLDSVAAIMKHIRDNDLIVEHILETHAHADHLSAAQYIKREMGGKICIGCNIIAVQKTFAALFNLGDDFVPDGSQFDTLLRDRESVRLGEHTGYALDTPGHTPACITYVFGDAAFVGDTLFMPDYGTARCDFPGGNAAALYRSINRIFELPDETRLFHCHDYKSAGRDHFAWESTIGDQKRNNIHVKAGITEEVFVAVRNARDATLPLPKLILPSIQVNIRAGALPPPESNGTRFLKTPLNIVGK